MNTKQGKIIIAGAGPGDPDLITLKLQRALKTADVILYDQLVPGPVLSDCRPDALCISVGKSGIVNSPLKYRQDEINALLREHAREGKTVLRLKGGDPFIFGRGSEECDMCVRAGIPFEVIPGISSPIAGAAYAGIPLTHRGISRSVAFATGHLQQGEDATNIVVPRADTIVYVMAIKNLELIVQKLIEAGYAPETPCALVENACTPRQRSFLTTLSNAVAVKNECVALPPALFIVGKVAEFHETLTWYEQKPLFGKTIAVTRTQAQALTMTSALRDLGANVIEYPVIEILPIADAEAILKEKDFLAKFSDIIFTSANAVDIFFANLKRSEKDARALHAQTITAIGKMTAQRLSDFGISADIIPTIYTAEGILDQLETDLTGRTFLLPRAKDARRILPEEIQRRGGNVDEVLLYEAVSPKDCRALERDTELDAICFTSTSTVVHFSEFNSGFKETAIFAIGGITEKSAREAGFTNIHVSDEATIGSLIQKIIKVFAQ